MYRTNAVSDCSRDPEQTPQRILRYGVELNMPAVYGSEQELASALRPYRIAKSCGCQFYLGSDAHHPADFEPIPEQFRALVELLSLEESNKFRPFE